MVVDMKRRGAEALGGVIVFAVLFTSCISPGSRDPNATPVDAYAAYETWAMVNSETITGDVTGTLGNAHEGSSGFREVYINEAGKAVSDGEAALPYPEGTIIIKEAYGNDSGSKSELSSLTVMVKRESGYDEGNGNWEYVMLTPSMRVRSQGALSSCISCHSAAENDFVFTDNR